MFIRTLCALLVTTLTVPILAYAANGQFIVDQFVGIDDPPTIPGNVVATPLSQTAITVTWNPSTDDTGLSGYEVYRNSMFLATVTAPTTGYSDTGLTSSTTYSYEVRAFDISLLFSAFSTSSATTTYATASSSTTITSRSGGGRNMRVLSLLVDAAASPDSIALTLESSIGVTAKVKWGTTADTLLGTLTLPGFKEEHRTTLTGLRPGTTYIVTIEVEDEYGRTLFKTIKVTTTVGGDGEAPSNPSEFEGTPTPKGTALRWKNPRESDFKEVRIMRHTGTVPVDPYDGVLIYEGLAEQFLDERVNEGTVYGYTIFAKDESGNYSSGAVTLVRAWSSIGIGDVQFPVDEHGEATTTLVHDMTIRQGEVVERIEDGVFTITNDTPFLLSVPTGNFPRVLKTILVTLRHPDGSGKKFTFLLRANRERTAYEARIDTLREAGSYGAVISFLNLSSQVVLKNDFTLNVVEGIGIPPEPRKHSRFSMLVGTLTLVLIIIVVVFLTARAMWRTGKDAAHRRTS